MTIGGGFADWRLSRDAGAPATAAGTPDGLGG